MRATGTLTDRDYTTIKVLVNWAVDNLPGAPSDNEVEVAQKVAHLARYGDEHRAHLRFLLRGYRDAGHNPIKLALWHRRVSNSLHATNLGDWSS